MSFPNLQITLEVAAYAPLILVNLRFEYKGKIEYENHFSVLVCRLHIVTSHTHLIPWATLST